MVPHLLLIDDDIELTELLAEYFSSEGFHVEAAHDGPSGLEQALAGDHALIILDVMLPGFNGFEVLRRLRAEKRTPVIMLTARGDDVDRIVGLEIGADDYLPKPFNTRELMARARAILRRSHAPAEPAAPTSDTLQVGALELNPRALTVTIDAAPLDLTSAEFSLLEMLLQHAGQVVSRDDLSEQVLGRPLSPYDRSLDVHISNLRKKMADHPSALKTIKTVRGTGYLYAIDSP